jgi:hypothetical protein
VRWAGNVVRIVQKSEGKKPFGTPNDTLEININVVLKEIMDKVVGWIHVAHYGDKLWALGDLVTKLRDP